MPLFLFPETIPGTCLVSYWRVVLANTEHVNCQMSKHNSDVIKDTGCKMLSLQYLKCTRTVLTIFAELCTYYVPDVSKNNQIQRNKYFFIV